MRSPQHVMCSELWAYPRVQEPVRSAVPRPSPIHVVLVPLGMVPATAFPVRFAEVCWSLAAVIVWSLNSNHSGRFSFIWGEEKNKIFGRTLVANHTTVSLLLWNRPGSTYECGDQWWAVLYKKGGENRPSFQVGSHPETDGYHQCWYPKWKSTCWFSLGWEPALWELLKIFKC
jgi:hypothetical protein